MLVDVLLVRGSFTDYYSTVISYISKKLQEFPQGQQAYKGTLSIL